MIILLKKLVLNINFNLGDWIYDSFLSNYMIGGYLYQYFMGNYFNLSEKWKIQ